MTDPIILGLADAKMSHVWRLVRDTFYNQTLNSFRFSTQNRLTKTAHDPNELFVYDRNIVAVGAAFQVMRITMNYFVLAIWSVM